MPGVTNNRPGLTTEGAEVTSRTTVLRGLVAAGAAAVLAVGAYGCGSDSSSSDTGASAGGGKSVALLLPESQTTRYDQQDRPLFEAKLKELCPDCSLSYANADQDSAKQLTQAEAAITNGVDVMVLDPVDGTAAGAIVTKAKAAGIPVISYDRLILNAEPDLYVSFDNEKVGTLQGDALAAKLAEDGNPQGPILKINGSPTDNNATLFKKGSNAALQSAGVKIIAQYDTTDWLPANAQKQMDAWITKYGKNGFKGVYAANDGTGGGAIAAMKAAGIDVSKIPTTGQDAELAAIQRIVAGQQYMTVYKAIKLEAEASATAAVALANGEAVPNATSTVNNGKIDVPSVLLDPVSVTVDNVADTVVADGFYTAAQICTADFAAACTKAGIQ